LNVYKIFVPPVPEKHLIGELKHILLAGIEGNPSTCLCDSSEEADYIFLDFRHLKRGQYEVTNPEKTVIIDYTDYAEYLYPHESLLYFKRSVVNKGCDAMKPYRRDIYPISYCVKDQYLHRRSQFPPDRDIDIAVFFDPDENPNTARNYYRSSVAQFIKNEFGHLNIFVGIAGGAGEAGRSGFQKDYFDKMTRARIVVTCNPDRWEGDYRLFEALSSGSLVLSDTMSTPVENPFIDWEHLIYYDKNNLDGLGKIIRELLIHDDLRQFIANNGYEHAMRFHKASDRIDEILARLEGLS
jgi:hypothetical protein